MITLILSFLLIDGALIAATIYTGNLIWVAGYPEATALFVVLFSVLWVQKLGKLTGNLASEYRHRRKHYSDLKCYTLLSPTSELFSVDKRGRPIPRGEIRRRYR